MLNLHNLPDQKEYIEYFSSGKIGKPDQLEHIYLVWCLLQNKKSYTKQAAVIRKALYSHKENAGLLHRHQDDTTDLMIGLVASRWRRHREDNDAATFQSFVSANAGLTDAAYFFGGIERLTYGSTALKRRLSVVDSSSRAGKLIAIRDANLALLGYSAENTPHNYSVRGGSMNGKVVCSGENFAGCLSGAKKMIGKRPPKTNCAQCDGSGLVKFSEVGV